jgi:hypothetical protein
MQYEKSVKWISNPFLRELESWWAYEAMVFHVNLIVNQNFTSNWHTYSENVMMQSAEDT